MGAIGLCAESKVRSRRAKPRIAAAIAKLVLPALAFGLLLVCVVPDVEADVLFLQSGDRISGRIVELEGRTLTIKTSYAGTLRIPRSELEAATTDEEVTVEFIDGSYATGLLRSAGQREMSISGARTGSREGFAFEDIVAITRGGVTPLGFRWSGRVNVGFTRNDGNSHTQSVHVDGAAEGRSKSGRISVDLVADHETDGGEETADDGRVRGKYDRFVNKRHYIYGGAGLQRDALADLTVRSAVGAGLGYQIYETAERSLSFEGGPAYVHEEFANRGGEDSGAFRWAADFKQQLFGGAATLFHDQEGFYKFAGNDAVLLFAKTGVRLPFRGALNVTAEVDVDYDGKPVPGKKSTDLKYILTLGYAW